MLNWSCIKLSRDLNRPCILDFINYISISFLEIHGDRISNDDKSIIGGISNIDGKHFMIIGHQKGKNFKERKLRNFGMSKSGGYRKALRLMKIAEKFNIPIIIMIDTPGAYHGYDAEQKCQSESIAKNIKEMFLLNVPILSFIIGEGASGGALGIGVSNKIFMLENSWYSVISPESCSSIIWKNIFYKKRTSSILNLTSLDMFKLNLIDGVINESANYSCFNISAVAESIKNEILKSVSLLSNTDVIEKRIFKFRNIGIFKEI